MKPELLIPVEGNHNQTIFLLSLTQARPGSYHLLRTRTESVADRAIKTLCHELGVRIVSQSEAQQVSYSRVYSHGWAAPNHALKGLRYEMLIIYGDGLTNRFMICNWPEAGGLVLWGSELFGGHAHELKYENLDLIIVSGSHIQQIWRLVFQTVDISVKPFFDYSNSLIVAMRYWGTSTYSGVAMSDVRSALASMPVDGESNRRILLKKDNRWNAKVSQESLVSGVFPNSEVEILEMPAEYRKKLGHLACMDALAFTHDFAGAALFGFDGSLPLTFALAQPDSKVLIPAWRPEPSSKLSSHGFIRENLDWHASLLGSDPKLLQQFSDVAEAKSLLLALSAVRKPVTISDDEFGAIARTLIGDWAAPDVNDVLFLESLLRKNDSPLRKGLARMLARAKKSRVITELYFSASRNLFLRKIIQRLTSRIGL